MFRPHQHRQKPGQPIWAKGLNRYISEVDWLARLRGGSGITVNNTPGGRLIQLNQPEQIYATITGPCNELGGYPWAQQIQLPNGSWAATGRVGGNDKEQPNYDPTYERRTGSTTVPDDGRRYVMQRASTSGEWLFAARSAVTDFCMPCHTPMDDTAAETVVWNLQSQIDYVAQIDGQTLSAWMTCPPIGERVAQFSTCFNTPVVPPGVDCLGHPLVLCGKLKFTSYVNIFANPVTFNLTFSNDGVASQVVPLFTYTLETIPPFPAPNCFAFLGPVTFTRVVQCVKTCVSQFDPVTGRTTKNTVYTLLYIDLLTAGSPLAVPIPNDLRDYVEEAIPSEGVPYNTFFLILKNPPPVFAIAAALGVLQRFTFPGDGSVGVVSCNPLHLLANYSVVTDLVCGLPGFTSANSIDVRRAT
jgi:hypothetical protein